MNKGQKTRIDRKKEAAGFSLSVRKSQSKTSEAEKADHADTGQSAARPKGGLFQGLHNPFRFTSLFRPMVYLYLFSLIYGWGTLKLMDLPDPWNDLLRCGWLALFGLGLYFVCTLIWGRRHKTLALKKTAEVSGVCLLLSLLTLWGVSPLSLAGSNLALNLTGALAGTLCLLFGVPSLILFFLAVYENRTGWKEQLDFILQAWKEKFWTLLNLWLGLFLLMFFWDNLMGGPLYSGTGFDAPALFTTVLFLKQPTLYFELLLLLSDNAAHLSELIMLGVLVSVIAVFLECNLIAWFGQAALSAQKDPEKEQKKR